MATVDKTPEFLKCIICHEVFKEPVTLHCGHTFCTLCVGGNKSQTEQTRDETTEKCHVCGCESVEGVERNRTKEGAVKIKPALFIKRLADEYTCADKGKDVCKLCKDEGKNKRGSFWCSVCGFALCFGCHSAHKKHTNPSHTTINITNSQVKAMQPKCDKHVDYTVDVLCEKCEEAVCLRCLITDHSNCTDFTRLEDSATKLKARLKQYSEELEREIPITKSNMSDSQSVADQLQTRINDVEKSIDETSDKFVAEIREQQEQLKKQLRQNHDTTLDQLQHKSESKGLWLQDAQQRIGFAEQALNSESVIDNYEIYRIFVKLRRRDNSAEDLNAGGGRSGANIRFIQNREMLTTLRKEKIGEIKGATAKQEKQLQYIDQIETEKTGIYGITILRLKGKKIIIVTNCIESKLQSYFAVMGKREKGSLKLTSPAYGITKLEDTSAAIAMPKIRKIGIIQVGPNPEDNPKLLTDFRTEMRYVDLSFISPTRLAAASDGEYGGFVDIIDLLGKRYATFGRRELEKPIFLCSILDNIWVSDSQNRSIFLFVKDSQEVKDKVQPGYEPIAIKPCGITMGAEGDVYIVDRLRHRVVEFDQSGQFVGDLLTFPKDNISDPYCIHVDTDNVMYLSVDDRYIYIYEIREV